MASLQTGTLNHTFFNDPSFLIQHALNFTSTHKHESRLLYKSLLSGKLCAIRQDWSNSYKETDIVFAKSYRIENVTHQPRNKENVYYKAPLDKMHTLRLPED